MVFLFLLFVVVFKLEGHRFYGLSEGTYRLATVNSKTDNNKDYTFETICKFYGVGFSSHEDSRVLIIGDSQAGDVANALITRAMFKVYH